MDSRLVASMTNCRYGRCAGRTTRAVFVAGDVAGDFSGRRLLEEGIVGIVLQDIGGARLIGRFVAVSGNDP